jgi:hypothetical protein
MRKNSYPNPRGDALTSNIDTYRRDHDARKRAAFVDRGLDGIVAGYSDAEFLRLQRCLLDRSQGSDGVFFRTRVDVLGTSSSGARPGAVQNSRTSATFPSATEGPSDCDAVVLKTTRGNTNAYGKSHFMGAIVGHFYPSVNIQSNALVSIHHSVIATPCCVPSAPGAVPLLAVAYMRGVGAKLPEPLELVPGERTTAPAPRSWVTSGSTRRHGEPSFWLGFPRSRKRTS